MGDYLHKAQAEELLALHNILHTSMAWYNLFVLKVPFKHQSRKQPYSRPQSGVLD